MYQEQDLTQVTRQIKARQLALLAIAVVMLTAVVPCFIARNQVLTIALSLALGVILIFCWDLFVKPLRLYASHLDRLLHGRLHEAEGVFETVDETPEMVEGVPCLTMHMTCLDDAGKPYDRIFHLDTEKSWPVWTRGQRVRVTYTARMAARVEAV